MLWRTSVHNLRLGACTIVGYYKIHVIEHVPYVDHVFLYKSIDKTNGIFHKNILNISIVQDHALLHHACIHILFDVDPFNG